MGSGQLRSWANRRRRSSSSSSSSNKSSEWWPKDVLGLVRGEQLGDGGRNRVLKRSKNVLVDLETEQQPALPDGWEQFLDLKTGEVYYIDWSTCKRTRRDPREAQRMADDRIRAAMSAYFTCSSSSSDASSSSSSSSCRPTSSSSIHRNNNNSSSSIDSNNNNNNNNGVYTNDSSSSGISNSSSSSSSSRYNRSLFAFDSDDDDDGDGDGDEDGNVMVAAACHACLMYYMLPRLQPCCPTCGAWLQLTS